MLGCGCTALNVSYNPNDEEHAMFYCDDINSPEKWDWWLKVWPQLSPCNKGTTIYQNKTIKDILKSIQQYLFHFSRAQTLILK